ncbi:MAG: peroxiredoxin [Candidatus Lokiarchaeota archaeon]|nr:peroxiredoxin [Candidatus Lokiarchaeota archaeon]MBD3200882.1 peroxiredoxin [Candidatus Lokiarchaeota archaeon]
MTEKKKGIPLIGDKFPQMQVQTTHGEMTLPDDVTEKEKWLIVFSHPADFTPVCTTEFHGFATRFDQFKELNTELVGLSIDQVFAHIKWTEWIQENLNIEIPFPIIADHGVVAEKLGMVHPGQGASTVRAVFIIDPNGIVRIILYYPKEIGRNMDEIIRALKALQTADREGAAVPANWPNNELIGDHVIVPPAKDVKTAKARLESNEHECFDWWLCHRPQRNK